MRQNMEREFPIPSDALERLFDEYEHVNDEDKVFFNNIYHVNQRDLSPIIDDILDSENI